MKLLKCSSLLFLLAIALFALIYPASLGRENTAELSAELLSDDVETETLPLYGECIESWDISETAGTDSVTARIYKYPSDAEKHLLVISGTGNMKNWSANSEVPWYKTYSGTLLAVIIENGVKNVGYYAFSYCQALESVSLADTVKTVGIQSFSYCTALKNIKLPAGLTYIAYYAFSYCTSLPSPDLNGAKRIYDGAYEGCTSITSVTVPANTTNIGLRTFAGCTSLTEILVEEGSTVYSSLDGDLYSADGKTLVVYAPGKTATSFEIPETVTSLAEYSMENSTLTSLYVGGSVESVGAYALRGSADLVSVTFGDGVKTLGSWALAECDSLTDVSFGGIETVGAYAFCYDDALVNVALSDSVKTLGESAFYSCKSLECIDLASVETVGQFAFSGCTSLADADLGSSVTELGASAFRGCTALGTVDLPESLETVGAYAFGGCTALSELTVRSETLAVSLITESDGGSLAKNAVNLYFTADAVGSYVTSAFAQKCAVLRSGELMWLYSTCAHSWTESSDGYACENCSTVRDAHDITKVNITVGYDLSVNVYADAPGGLSVVFTMNGASVETSGTFVESLGLWRYTFEGVTPQCMGDYITAELTLSGVPLSTLADYSILTYCNNVLSMSASQLGITEEKHTALRTLIFDLMDYGAAAQLYTGYKTDALVNGGTEGGLEFSELTNTDFTLENITVTDGVYFTAASLWFDSTNRLAFKFKATDITEVTVRVTKGGKTQDCTAEDFIEQGGVYVLLSDRIYATGFDNVYTVTLIYGETEVQRLTYSVLAYIAEKQSSSDPLESTLVKATYCYGASADAYAEAK